NLTIFISVDSGRGLTDQFQAQVQCGEKPLIDVRLFLALSGEMDSKDSDAIASYDNVLSHKTTMKPNVSWLLRFVVT
ncbi:MAG: hypothetical protein PVI89_13375, partial [Desulfobacteraceae bacterium]